MDQFAFHPELFEHRSGAIEELSARGYEWFTHYSSVDLLHDLCGLEVCGIHRKRDAGVIMKVLEEIFPDWTYSDIYYYKYERDRGWKAMIFKTPRRQKDFKTA